MTTSNNNINVHITLLLDSCRSVAVINSEIILSANVPLGVLGYKVMYKTKKIGFQLKSFYHICLKARPLVTFLLGGELQYDPAGGVKNEF